MTSAHPDGPPARRSPWRRMVLPVMQRFRSRRGDAILAVFPDLATYRVADVGGSVHYWDSIGLQPASVDIYNISLDQTDGADAERNASIILYDGHRLPTDDASYDLALSNSVIEHVPLDQRAAFAAEMTRVGRRVFLQTPNYWFPLEPHFVFPFLHWLPRSIGRHVVAVTPWRLLSRPAPERRRSYFEEIRLLRRSELEQLFPGAEIRPEKVLGLTKSWYVIRR